MLQKKIEQVSFPTHFSLTVCDIIKQQKAQGNCSSMCTCPNLLDCAAINF